MATIWRMSISIMTQPLRALEGYRRQAHRRGGADADRTVPGNVERLCQRTAGGERLGEISVKAAGAGRLLAAAQFSDEKVSAARERADEAAVAQDEQKLDALETGFVQPYGGQSRWTASTVGENVYLNVIKEREGPCILCGNALSDQSATSWAGSWGWRPSGAWTCGSSRRVSRTKRLVLPGDPLLLCGTCRAGRRADLRIHAGLHPRQAVRLRRETAVVGAPSTWITGVCTCILKTAYSSMTARP